MTKKEVHFFVRSNRSITRITTLNHSDFMKYPDKVGEVLEDGILSLDDP